MKTQRQVGRNLNEVMCAFPKEELSDMDHLFLNAASSEAVKSTAHKQRIGSVIYMEDGTVLAKGMNKAVSHEIQQGWSPFVTTLHAEMDTLVCAMESNSAEIRSGNWGIAVSRVTRQNDEPGCSYPCKHCFPTLKSFGCKFIICYDENGEAVRINL